MSDEIDAYVDEHAPDIEPHDVRKFIAGNEKPTSEPGTHVEWAVKQLRRHKETDEDEEGPSLEIVEEEMRRHDEWHE
jgi:hypothetical protein